MPVIATQSRMPGSSRLTAQTKRGDVRRLARSDRHHRGQLHVGQVTELCLGDEDVADLRLTS